MLQAAYCNSILTFKKVLELQFQRYGYSILEWKFNSHRALMFHDFSCLSRAYPARMIGSNENYLSAIPRLTHQ